MAAKKFEKGSIEWQMFTDYWALCQKFWEPEDSDTYWEEVIKATDEFYKKHNTLFARALALELVNEVERKSKDSSLYGRAIRKEGKWNE